MANVTAVAGLGFGDEGKGSIVDYLTRRHGTKLVVRHNGGAQAAHNVVTDDGRHHCFAQWGSGTFAGARTLLSRFMMCNPIFAASEARHLESVGITNPWSLLHVERDALITTPFHVAANRLQEIARRRVHGGSGVHGSCGMGIGETMRDFVDKREDCVFARDLADPKTLQWKLSSVRERKLVEIAELDLLWPENAIDLEFNVLRDHSIVDDIIAIYENFAARTNIVDETFLARKLAGDGHVIFEGAQGVLLDEWWGFHPYTTWSTCTFENADKLLTLAGFPGRAERLGVLRTYCTRHGAGPMPTGGREWDALSADDHNKTGAWQEDFRSGPFDAVLARYALDVVGGCDGLAFTHLDKLVTRPRIEVCWGYRHEGRVIKEFQRKIPNDLVAQEALGNVLKTAEPMLSDSIISTPEGSTCYALMLGEALGTPVVITSSGKTAESKSEVRTGDAGRAA